MSMHEKLIATNLLNGTWRYVWYTTNKDGESMIVHVGWEGKAVGSYWLLIYESNAAWRGDGTSDDLAPILDVRTGLRTLPQLRARIESCLGKSEPIPAPVVAWLTWCYATYPPGVAKNIPVPLTEDCDGNILW